MKVILVRGGLVASVYSKEREKIYVFDYDGEDAKELKENETEMQKLIKNHHLKKIY